MKPELLSHRVRPLCTSQASHSESAVTWCGRNYQKLGTRSTLQHSGALLEINQHKPQLRRSLLPPLLMRCNGVIVPASHTLNRERGDEFTGACLG